MGIFDKQVSDTQIKLGSRLWLYIFSLVVLFLLVCVVDVVDYHFF